MSRDDYRPADYQVEDIYNCYSCGKEWVSPSCYGIDEQCSCGGRFIKTGESYPADPSEWDEQRDPDGEWRKRRW